jgi:hypothetical protein
MAKVILQLTMEQYQRLHHLRQKTDLESEDVFERVLSYYESAMGGLFPLLKQETLTPTDITVPVRRVEEPFETRFPRRVLDYIEMCSKIDIASLVVRMEGVDLEIRANDTVQSVRERFDKLKPLEKHNG